MKLTTLEEILYSLENEVKSLNEIADYIYKLTSIYNKFYSEHKVLVEENKELQESWLVLTKLVYDINNGTIAYDENIAKGLLIDNGWKYTSNKWRKTVNYRYLSIELDLLVNNKIATSRREAREFLGNNAISINGNIEKDEKDGVKKNILNILKSIYEIWIS